VQCAKIVILHLLYYTAVRLGPLCGWRIWTSCSRGRSKWSSRWSV